MHLIGAFLSHFYLFPKTFVNKQHDKQHETANEKTQQERKLERSED